MLDVEVGGGTPGSRLHGNPMYSGRAVSIFTLSLAAVTVGAAYNMLDEYERLMRERKTTRCRHSSRGSRTRTTSAGTGAR